MDIPDWEYKRVVLVIDNAPWHRGKPTERFERLLRRRATHNRLFNTLTDLKTSIRNSLGYFQTVRTWIKTLLHGPPSKQTQSPGP